MYSRSSDTILFLLLTLNLFFLSRAFAFRPSSFLSIQSTTTTTIINMSENDHTSAYFTSTIALNPASTQVGMAAALDVAAQENWQVTICIADAGGVPMHVQRTANAFAASYDIACGKAKSAALFAKNTGALEGSANGGRAALLSSPFLVMRGGVPIVHDGKVCGSVGVSGVQAEQDEAVAQAAVEAISQVLLTGVVPTMRSRL